MFDPEYIILELVKKAKLGDEKAYDDILKILEKDLKKLSKKFYIVGSDDQDVLQECRIGVWKAIKDFSTEGGMSFKNFAINMCCKRHLKTAITHANTQKFRHQNEAVSLSSPVNSDDDNCQSYEDYIQDYSSDLEYNYIVKEEFQTNLAIAKNKFTKLELSIFGQFAFNTSYKDIASALDIKAKSVDNTLLRVRKKSSEIYKYYLETHSVIGVYTGSIGINTMCLIDEILDVRTLLGIMTSFSV
jgi:RNA polymerase sporulation-specific sigma factor